MRLIAAVLIVSCLSPAAMVVSPSARTASAAACGVPAELNVAAAGPLGGISVLGDSVLMGAAFAPSLPTLLAATGWGPVKFQGACGMTAGNYQPAGSQFSAANYIGRWRAAGWDAPTVAVNLGNNDVGFCGDRGVAECATTIRYLLDAIGPGHTVWWSKITRPFDAAVPYNQALDLVATERSNLRVWDWPAAQQANAVALGPDYIHLRDTPAYQRRSELMSADITA